VTLHMVSTTYAAMPDVEARLRSRNWKKSMRSRTPTVALALTFAIAVGGPAWAQKYGGTLRVYNSSNPPSASIIEEATIATAMAFSGVFNNLVLFDQSKTRNGLDTIVPELAESWSWDAPRTKLTFTLRRGVHWHDGKPFTSKDVQCTWNKIQGKDPDEFRKNPRKVWWKNLNEVTVNGDFEVAFAIEQPQPSFLMLLASNLSPIYPCHVSAKDMAH
jgi:peptide/nickel transport system substrate-binding protein